MLHYTLQPVTNIYFSFLDSPSFQEHGANILTQENELCWRYSIVIVMTVELMVHAACKVMCAFADGGPSTRE